MTTIPSDLAAEQDAHAEHDAHDHPAHLAHHFDTPVQQYASGKLGMWVFLGTEILMFGGLFVAYAVYRYNHPEVFAYASQRLNTALGLINTIVLITSSLTMALAVNFVQRGNKTATLVCLIITLGGGFGFMGIKTVEYYQKISHGYFVGPWNEYSTAYEGERHLETSAAGHGEEAAGHGDESADHGTADAPLDGDAAEGHAAAEGDAVHAEAAGEAETPAPADEPLPNTAAAWGMTYLDPHAGTGDATVIHPPLAAEATSTVPGIRDNEERFFGNHNATRPLTDEVEGYTLHPAGHTGQHVLDEIHYDELAARDQQKVASFYGIYFAMTGLHGLHVLIGMGLITWISIKTAAGVFSPAYFTPVDLVGLYWHLVDLIWIFLFPLLYLI